MQSGGPPMVVLIAPSQLTVGVHAAPWVSRPTHPRHHADFALAGPHEPLGKQVRVATQSTPVRVPPDDPLGLSSAASRGTVALPLVSAGARHEPEAAPLSAGGRHVHGPPPTGAPSRLTHFAAATGTGWPCSLRAALALRADYPWSRAHLGQRWTSDLRRRRRHRPARRRGEAADTWGRHPDCRRQKGGAAAGVLNYATGHARVWLTSEHGREEDGFSVFVLPKFATTTAPAARGAGATPGVVAAAPCHPTGRAAGVTGDVRRGRSRQRRARPPAAGRPRRAPRGGRMDSQGGGRPATTFAAVVGTVSFRSSCACTRRAP